MTILPLLLLVGLFQFGWIFWPKLGIVWTVINAVVLIGFMLAALFIKMFGRSKLQ